ncbi:MAG: aquaporin [Thermoanaerobaculia bacterium]
MALVLGKTLADPSVNFVATVPGPQGAGAAFLAEMLMSFALMTVVLLVSNTRRLARFTGVFAGALVAAHITFLDPLSGMSMNPARTLGSAVPARLFTGLWIYFTAPPLGMLLAAQLHLRLRGLASVACAKLHHQNSKRCIFCEHQAARGRAPEPVVRAIPLLTD